MLWTRTNSSISMPLYIRLNWAVTQCRTFKCCLSEWSRPWPWPIQTPVSTVLCGWQECIWDWPTTPVYNSSPGLCFGETWMPAQCGWYSGSCLGYFWISGVCKSPLSELAASPAVHAHSSDTCTYSIPLFQPLFMISCHRSLPTNGCLSGGGTFDWDWSIPRTRCTFNKACILPCICQTSYKAPCGLAWARTCTFVIPSHTSALW